MNPAPPVTSTASFTPPIVAFDSLGDFAPSWRHFRAPETLAIPHMKL